MFELIAFVGVGALASFLGGLVGLGGGFILVPLLTIQMQMDIKDAVIFSLICLTWAGLQQSFQNRHLIQNHAPLLRPLLILVAIGAAGAAVLGVKLSSDFLNNLLGVVLISLAIYMYADRHWEAGPASGSHQPHKVSYLFFLASGSLGGLLGLGGGIFNVPVLHKMFRIPIYESTRLNFPLILISAVAALSVFYVERKEAFHALSPVHAFVLVIGTALGASMSKKIKIQGHKLKITFAVLTLAMGILKIAS